MIYQEVLVSLFYLFIFIIQFSIPNFNSIDITVFDMFTGKILLHDTLISNEKFEGIEIIAQNNIFKFKNFNRKIKKYRFIQN